MARRLRALLHPGLLLAVAAIAGFYLWKGCPIRYFTGIACPGCGMTRAAWSLLRLDFAAAAHWHPLVFMVPPLALLLYWPRSPLARPKIRNWVLGAAGVLFATVYLYRLWRGDGSVVAIGPPPFWADLAKISNFITFHGGTS